MKIGILTHYYGSNNYGGVLQSYALVKALRKMGYDAEQICFDYADWRLLDESCVYAEKQNDDIPSKDEILQPKKACLLVRIFRRIKRAIYSRTKGRIIRKKEQERLTQIRCDYFDPRKKEFGLFRDNIKHSDLVYTVNTLFIANDVYDAFITGSDQVWNLAWQNPAFFLEFVDNGKLKIAYAASAGASSFDEVQQKYLKRTLPKFDAISVRENDLVETYKEIAGVDAKHVLDPTLMLEKEDWDIEASPRLIDDKYLFCMFYNPTEKQYELANQYAEKHGLKIATISYALLNEDEYIDDDFGDYKMGAASPNDFISLVKFAECVFTDSFHCAVFSCIYDKPFFCFERKMENIGKKMESRVKSLVEMFHCEERFCNVEEKMNIDYLLSIEDKPFDKSELIKKRTLSIDFLRESLGK